MNRPLLITSLSIALVLPALAEEKAGPHDNHPPEGFVALFNGKDLTNWQGAVDIKTRSTIRPEDLSKRQEAADKLAHDTWSEKDGILIQVPKIVEVKGKKEKRGINLATTKDFGDFEFWVDWKIEEAGDSGIYLRGNPQVQIWDSDNLKGETLKPDLHTGSGGLWNNPLPKGVDPKTIGKTPLKKADKPVGEWNTFKIVMKGDRVTVRLNGELVVDNAPLANYWDKGKPLPEKGPIELQYHGDKLWFKNIYVKELK